MKVTGFYWERFAFNFNTSFKNSGRVYREKEGFYIYAEIDNLNTFVGECSPLPGVNSESIGDVALELEQLNDNIIGFEFYDYGETVSFINRTTPVSSIKFALTQIFFTSLLTEILPDSLSIKLNGIISRGDIQDVLHNISILAKNGFNTIKLKIGNDSPENEITVIREIADRFPAVSFRLDANSALSYQEALNFIDKISGLNIEYFEDPLASPDEMKKLSEISPIPIAADTFISGLSDINQFMHNSRIRHFIIKPMAFQDTPSLPAITFPEGAQIIISSSFESFVGRIFNYILASRFSNVHGLATASLLNEGLIDTPFREDLPVITFAPKNVLSWLNDKVLY